MFLINENYDDRVALINGDGYSVTYKEFKDLVSSFSSYLDRREGYAKDYVKAMWLMTQQDIPNDYIIATGKTKTIKDFVEAAAIELGIKNCMQYIKINPSLIKRSADNILVGDPYIAKNQLGWEHSLSFNQLVGLMVKNEIAGSLD